MTLQNTQPSLSVCAANTTVPVQVATLWRVVQDIRQRNGGMHPNVRSYHLHLLFTLALCNTLKHISLLGYPSLFLCRRLSKSSGRQ